MLVITLGLDLHFLLLSNMVWETFLDLGYIFDDNVGTLLVHDWKDQPVLTTVTTTAYPIQNVS